MNARHSSNSTLTRHPTLSLPVARSRRRSGRSTGWWVTIVVAGDETFDRRIGKSLAASLTHVAGSVHGRVHDPITGATTFQAMLVLDDTERHLLDAASAGLRQFRLAAAEVGLPDWPVIEIRVGRPDA